jgi:hypothetical protein
MRVLRSLTITSFDGESALLLTAQVVETNALGQAQLSASLRAAPLVDAAATLYANVARALATKGRAVVGAVDATGVLRDYAP